MGCGGYSAPHKNPLLWFKQLICVVWETQSMCTCLCPLCNFLPWMQTKCCTWSCSTCVYITEKSCCILSLWLLRAAEHLITVGCPYIRHRVHYALLSKLKRRSFVPGGGWRNCDSQMWAHLSPISVFFFFFVRVKTTTFLKHEFASILN